MATARNAPAASTANRLLLLFSLSLSPASKVITKGGGPPAAAAAPFRCRTCGRSFATFQALGGHRTSHNRPWVCAPRQGSRDDGRPPVQRVRHGVSHRTGARRTHAQAQGGGGVGCRRAGGDAAGVDGESRTRNSNDVNLFLAGILHHPGRLLLIHQVLAVAVIAVASLGAATADDHRPVFLNYTCSATGNYTEHSPYGKNLSELLNTLSRPAAVDNWWFRNRTVGVAPDDQVSGLAMCFADSKPEWCLNCLASVIPEYHLLFPMCYGSRDVGFLSSDGCVVRYAGGAPFFGSADPTPRLVLRSGFKRAADTSAMRKARRGLLGQLAEMAGGDARRFAAGSQGYNDTVLGAWQVMYGMAQCTRDLPPGECTSCLIDHLAVVYRDVSVINCTDASVMGLSCYLSYQVNEPIHIAGMEAVPPSPPPAAEPPTGSAPPAPVGHSKTPALIAALAAAAVTLFSAGV
ncbi:cysteine-rich repeat secretory protein 38-like [Panicum miliaceum]|uniref:Cysteine-rich repeat secretory protein 38-like n=1 Tax=Panicum miliaceum TaxID=4540 RepID=A0A3L6Q137_PANMI|nr:cysteine-rich repeat secretory protein 38-like [Panicum miliaceum]